MKRKRGKVEERGVKWMGRKGEGEETGKREYFHQSSAMKLQRLFELLDVLPDN
jgi:hypothetical protein